MTKYKPETKEITSENVKAFVSDVLDGKLKVTVFHSELPDKVKYRNKACNSIVILAAANHQFNLP